jgi:hypothetical protein
MPICCSYKDHASGCGQKISSRVLLSALYFTNNLRDIPR